MTPLYWALSIIAIVAIVLAVAVSLRMRTKKLRSRFGPEYDRVVQEQGGAFKAERELENREKRVEKFQIRPLSDDERVRFAKEWREVQEKFVDDPRGSVAGADSLLHQTMKARGYPITAEFESRVADLSVDHPLVMEHYRAAHEIAAQDARHAASTEELRLAMKHYRTLFEDLLGSHVEEVSGARR
jgi:hypothetical protein